MLLNMHYKCNLQSHKHVKPDYSDLRTSQNCTLKLHSLKAASCPTRGEGKAMGRTADLHVFNVETNPNI